MPSNFAGTILPSQVPITHFMFVILEDRSYDHYFGTYCLATGSFCSMNSTGIPSGTCVPKYPNNPSAGCIKPYPYPNITSDTTDPAHTWDSSHDAYNNGSNNGFWTAENQNIQVFGYYNGSLIATYWDLAEQYALGDHWFSSVLSYSLPEHWNTVAARAPAVSELSGVAGKVGTLSSSQITYLGQANKTPTIEDALVNSTVSWKYYDFPLPTYGHSLDTKAGGECLGQEGAFNYWAPLAGRAESYNATLSPHFVGRDSVFSDLSNGTLPNVSYVIPNCIHSDHPPETPAGGQKWVAHLVDALGQSPDWNTTVMFITWDDYGGFYDHVPPQQITSVGLGFRVPLIVVSPYSKENFVSHTQEYFQSFLHLIEWRFALPISSGLGSHAPLPLEYFNFSQKPRPPIHFGGYGNDTYPMPLQTLPVVPASVPIGVSVAPGPGGPIPLVSPEGYLIAVAVAIRATDD